jgi:predicted glycosyltransferase involved in capsule biosynthesis
MNKYSINNILIILPYGNINPKEKRNKQLNILVPHLTQLIKDNYSRKVKYFILVSEQVSPKKLFNRGLIINIGVHYFRNIIGAPTNIIFHDIDILPNKHMFKEYSQSDKQSYSIIPIKSKLFQKIYGFKLTTGSAVYLTKPDLFIKANGYPNNFWGWGGEDNALHQRYKQLNIPLEYNEKSNNNFKSIDYQRANNAEKMAYLKKNKIRNMTVWELLKEDKNKYKENGYKQLDDLDYQIIKEEIENIAPNLIYIHIKSKLKKKEE